MSNATSATVATCRVCNGWTLLIMNFPDDTAADLRSNAKSIAEAVKNGRDIHTKSPDEVRALSSTPCRCPKPEKPGRR